MEDCKPAPSPFLSGVKLSATCTSPEVDASLLVVFYTWLILVLTFPLTLVVLPIICKLLMKVTRKQQKEFFDIFEVQFSLGLITVQGETFVGWFHWFRLGRRSWWSKVYCRLCFQSGIWTCTWACKKQQALSLSLAEAEYRAVVNANQEVLWLRQILSEFGFEQQ